MSFFYATKKDEFRPLGVLVTRDPTLYSNKACDIIVGGNLLLNQHAKHRWHVCQTYA